MQRNNHARVQPVTRRILAENERRRHTKTMENIVASNYVKASRKHKAARTTSMGGAGATAVAFMPSEL